MQFNNPRYQGKPLLRLLECYVLWAINRLPAESKNVLEEMTPKLQKTYKKHGTWQEVLAEVMEFTPDMPEQIQSLWKKT